MTTYKQIFGKPVKILSSDPANEAEGQVWYNSTSGTFKSVVAIGAWSSGSNLLTGRRGARNIGTQASSLFVSGNLVGPPGTTLTVIVEEYNGSGWSSSPSVSNAVYGFSNAGTSTAGLKAGGFYPPINNTEEYDGSSWTGGGALNQARGTVSGAGTQTAGLAFGGRGTPDTTYRANVEEYNGSAWANVNAMPTASGDNIGGGIQTSAISAGGENPTLLSNVFEYDGTNWTTGTSLPAGNSDAAGSGSGSTDFLVFGGTVSPNTTSLKYDGSAWTATASLATGRRSLAGSGSPSSASIAAGGAPVTNNGTNTEEYNFSATVTTGAAFSSLPTLNTARWGLGGAGTKSAAIVFGGRNPPVGQDLALSEEYNGTSWSEGPDLNTATRVCGRGTGTSTAALKHGGHSGSPSTSNKTAEEWNGSSWSNGGASTNNHDGTMQIGTQTAAASCGSNPPTGAKTEEYNGTSWTASNDMPYSAYQGSASGSQTAGVVFGGGYPAKNNSAEYDGTNWTAGNTLLQTTVGQGGNGGSGTQALAIGAGGYTPGPTYLTSAFTYDGTNFATSPSLATARQEVAAQGANTSFYVAGGLTSPGAATNVVEEFTPESTAANVKTLTSS